MRKGVAPIVGSAGGGGVLATRMVGGPLVQTRPVPTIRSFLVPAPGPTMQWQGLGPEKWFKCVHKFFNHLFTERQREP